MEQIGYSLIDDKNNEIQFWGDTPGQCVGVPEMIILPSGDQLHCPVVGESYEGLKFVPRVCQIGAEEAVSYDGYQIVATKIAPPVPTPLGKLESIGLTLDDLKKLLGIA